MGKIYLTSDLHFNHDKDFIWKERGFNSVDEMNETIIKNWNSIITNEDTVYILGDIMLGADLQAGLRLINKLKGQKYLAIGNHDTDARIKAYKANPFFKDIQMGYRIKYKKKTCILTHYPTVTANGDDTRTINFFGHTHQTENFFEEKPYMYHVGVDSHNCFPICIDNAIEEIKHFKNLKGEKNEK